MRVAAGENIVRSLILREKISKGCYCLLDMLYLCIMNNGFLDISFYSIHIHVNSCMSTYLLLLSFARRQLFDVIQTEHRVIY